MKIIPVYPIFCMPFGTVEYKFCLPKKVKCNDYDPGGLFSKRYELTAFGTACAVES